MAGVEHEGLLMHIPCRTKLSPSTGTSHNTLLNAKTYDATEDDSDEEGVKNPYGNVDINEETTLGIPITELPNAIEEKKERMRDSKRSMSYVKRLNYYYT